MQLKPVEEQVVALVGASSGIGRETALRFAARGARVVVSARGEQGLNSLVQEIRNEGGQATAVPADTTDFEQVRAVAQRAVEEYGHLDTWVHLAAVRAQVGLRGQREVLLRRLPGLEIPTLVVWGARDRVLPESQARDAAARIRKGSLAVIPDCGHLPHIERPDQFVAALERFLG